MFLTSLSLHNQIFLTKNVFFCEFYSWKQLLKISKLCFILLLKFLLGSPQFVYRTDPKLLNQTPINCDFNFHRHEGGDAPFWCLLFSRWPNLVKLGQIEPTSKFACLLSIFSSFGSSEKSKSCGLTLPCLLACFGWPKDDVHTGLTCRNKNERKIGLVKCV